MATTLGPRIDEMRSRGEGGDAARAGELDAIEGHAHSIGRIARSTLSVGLSPLLVGILADPFEPKFASLGAYRWVAAALAAHSAGE
jgi:hypothetical protein